MAYTPGIFYVDPDTGNDAARTALTTVIVSNPSGTITRANKTAHGLVTGDIVDGLSFSAWLNDAFRITVVDANNFDLDNTVWQATADNNGTMTPRGGCRQADAWKSLGGATAARVGPGDAVRMKESPTPTLVGNADWTYLSKTVTLAAAVTANITDCETAWTGSANVTQTADTVQFKQGTKSAKSVISTAFTTGLVAYFATGTLDLSAYQQVSLWVYNSGVAIAANTMSLRLCSDAAGAVTVHTIPIPAIASTAQWTAVTFDNAAALSASIASVALYADLDPGALTIQVDNIIACKASSSADALHLGSYIGKVHNMSWTATTAYSLNAKRRPTQPNRNGFQYKVTTAGTTGGAEPTWPQDIGLTVTDGTVVWTCVELEDTWYPVQSINGTTVMIDANNTILANGGRGYGRATELGVATYRREAFHLTPMVSTPANANTIADGGTGPGSQAITYSGGWDAATMSTMTGETWVDMLNGRTNVFNSSAPYVVASNLNAGRASLGHTFSGGCNVITNCHASGGLSGSSFAGAETKVTGINVHGGSSATQIASIAGAGAVLSRAVIQGNASASGDGVSVGADSFLTLAESINHGAYSANALDDAVLQRVHTSASASGGLNQGTARVFLTRCTLDETPQFATYASLNNQYVRSQNHGDVANTHLLVTDGGTIQSATDQRHTASGISWKFNPTSVARAQGYPLRLSVAKIACAAGVATNVRVWVYRDNANIAGQLRVRGGVIAGIPQDVVVSCAPTINTWVQSSVLTFTPTADEVVEVFFECWDGVGTTNSLWIDDLTAA